MARPLRIEYPGAFYHVTSRGNERKEIFRDGDQPLLLETLDRAIDRFGWLCHAYCLMSNHYHLVVETPRPNLARGMRHLNGVYAQRFNRRHRRVGHLFQARYDAKVIEDEAHLLACARYVVRNPVRARLCNHPADWPWSSYRATAALEPAPRFLHTNTILTHFSDDPDAAQAAYREFVMADDDSEPALIGDLYLGRPAFAEQLAPKKRLPERPLTQTFPTRPPLSTILTTGHTGILEAYEHGYTLHQIARELGVHYSTASRALARLERLQDQTHRKT